MRLPSSKYINDAAGIHDRAVRHGSIFGIDSGRPTIMAFFAVARSGSLPLDLHASDGGAAAAEGARFGG